MKKKVLIIGLVFFVATLIVAVVVSYNRVISSNDPPSLPLRFVAFTLAVPVFIAIRLAPSITVPFIILVIILILLSIKRHNLFLVLIAYTLLAISWLYLVYVGTMIPFD